MKIKTFGYQGVAKSINLLEKSFEELGHTVITEGEPQYIFDLNGLFFDALAYKSKYPKAKTIFNILNADVLNPEWPAEKVKDQMSRCDIPTTVSESTRKDVLERTGVDCKIIYYPMRPYQNLNYPRSLDFLYVGRLYNREKRFALIPETLKLLNYSISNLVVAGSEPFPEAFNTGPLSNEDLNSLYNSAKFLFCPCWREGSMSMLEAVVAGVFPIVCNDNFWVSEFGLDKFACDPTPFSLASKVMEIQNNPEPFKIEMERLKPAIIEKFDSLNVAKRIIELYNTII